MKFLVDAHLPPDLCGLLQAAGHDAVRPSQLTAQNQTPDEVINTLSLTEQRVVITKDSDFYLKIQPQWIFSQKGSGAALTRMVINWVQRLVEFPTHPSNLHSFPFFLNLAFSSTSFPST